MSEQTTDYLEYTKCGEILIANSINYKEQYILKCTEFDCTEYYSDLEKLLLHCVEHQESIKEESEDESTSIPDLLEELEYGVIVKNEVSDDTANDVPLPLTERDESSLQTIETYDINVNECDEDFEEGEDGSNADDDEEFLETENIAFAKTFMKSEKNIRTLIAAYKNCEPLWNTNFSKRTRYKDRQTNLEQISTELKELLNVEITSNQVASAINRLRQMYRQQLKEQKSNEGEQVVKTKDNWFFDQLHFLEPFAVLESEPNYSAFVKSFLTSRKNVTSFIAEYKECPLLWNCNLSKRKRYDERKNNLEKIATELKTKLNLELTCGQVAAVVNRLRQIYRFQENPTARSPKNPKYQKYKKNDSNKYDWFIKKLDFLKPFLKSTCPFAPIAHLDDLYTELTQQQVIEILQIYERYPVLWDTNLIENFCDNKRLEAVEEMQATIIAEMDLKPNTDTLTNYVNQIQAYFTKLKRRIINNDEDIEESESDLYRHMIFLEEHAGPFMCAPCNREFSNALLFRAHTSKHDGSVPFQCSLCKNEYNTAKAYMSHAKRHMDALKDECKVCGKKCLRAADLRVHMRTHTGAKPFCCEVCGQSFRYANQFTTHMRRHENKHSHKCPYCAKGFYSSQSLKNHVTKHTNTRNFECKLCFKLFKTKSNLRSHTFIHEEGRKYPCTLCGKMFKNKIGVHHHMKTHRKKDMEGVELV